MSIKKQKTSVIFHPIDKFAVDTNEFFSFPFFSV